MMRYRKQRMRKGTATQGEDVAAFVDPVLSGNRMTWSQRVTKPLSLHLKFEVTVKGNAMVGVAKRASCLHQSRGSPAGIRGCGGLIFTKDLIEKTSIEALQTSDRVRCRFYRQNQNSHPITSIVVKK
ncbi:hypothetical protein CF651_05345 [Paenibacillus rigui]|uniref:Uncharacterized protein n=1 Tax=Paenibacillus rigui TaxID=554312 RepID=A0A229UU91_9BACL|nr:hypothetical protein CF651_05345 [Paenibacillus rigui]